MRWVSRVRSLCANVNRLVIGNYAIDWRVLCTGRCAWNRPEKSLNFILFFSFFVAFTYDYQNVLYIPIIVINLNFNHVPRVWSVVGNRVRSTTDEKNHVFVLFSVSLLPWPCVASSHSLINLSYLLVVFLINDVMLFVRLVVLVRIHFSWS